VVTQLRDRETFSEHQFHKPRAFLLRYASKFDQMPKGDGPTFLIPTRAQRVNRLVIEAPAYLGPPLERGRRDPKPRGHGLGRAARTAAKEPRRKLADAQANAELRQWQCVEFAQGTQNVRVQGDCLVAVHARVRE
jgi:hypothetical protein